MPLSAKLGDVAVFRDRGNPSHGHVAFFQEIDAAQPSHIKVLGGNQITRQHLHVIDVMSLRVDSGLELVTLRRKPGLQSA
jgi:hypothetical protein